MGGRRVTDRSADRLERLDRTEAWDGIKAVVAGMGVSGFAAADNLTHLGASVTALDESEAGDRGEKATLLEILGATVRLGEGSTATLPADVDVLVTSPGWRPDAPLLAQAVARGIPIWGEVELAWRLRNPDKPAPWLAITGTNGKTTTVQMLEQMLLRAGLRTVACGNVGLPIVEAVMADHGNGAEPYDVLAVELSSFQLHYTSSMRAHSAAVLNVAEDHLDWYPSMTQYTADKARIYAGVSNACVYNVQDPVTEQLVRDADVTEGARAIGFTLGTPAVGMLGLVEDVLADRAFVEDRHSSAAELATLADLASPALRRERARRGCTGPFVRCRSSRGSRCAARFQAGRPPDLSGRDLRGRDLGRRLEGHQPASGARLAAGLRPGRVDRGWAGQGSQLRRVGRPGR
jgi:UDP-N-acetylmuramoylalanine--D-glutamate ligase